MSSILFNSEILRSEADTLQVFSPQSLHKLLFHFFFIFFYFLSKLSQRFIITVLVLSKLFFKLISRVIRLYQSQHSLMSPSEKK